MRLVFLLFCPLILSTAETGRVKVRIFDHRAEHDPMSNYGTGPFRFRGYGWGINYEFEPDGRFQQEKGYGFVKIFARDFCKFKDRSKCRDSEDLDLHNEYKSYNNGEPFWGQPPADVTRDHERFQTSDEPHPAGPRGKQESDESSGERIRDYRDGEKERNHHRDSHGSTEHSKPHLRNQPQYSRKNLDDRVSSDGLERDLEPDERPIYNDRLQYYRLFDYNGPPEPPRRIFPPKINEEYSPFKKYSSLDRSFNDDLEERKVYLHQMKRRRKLVERIPRAHLRGDRQMDGHDSLIGDLRERKYRKDYGISRAESLGAIGDDSMPNSLENIDHSKYFVRIPKKS